MADGQQSRIKIRVENTDYDVVGGEFQQLLAAVKALPQRRFDGQLKLWHVSGSLAMVQGQLENSGFTLEGGTPVAGGAQTASPPPSNDRIKIEVEGQSLLATGAPFQTMLEVIKALPGRRFDGEARQWTIPGALADIKPQLEAKGLQLKTASGNPLPAQSVAGSPAEEAVPPSFDDHFPAPADVTTGVAPTTPPPPPPTLPADFPLPDQGFYDEEDEFEGPAYFDDTPPPLPPEAAPAQSPSPASTGPQTGRRDQIRVIVKNTPMVVVGGAFREMLAAVKELPDRRFDGETKQWLLNDDLESIQQHLAAKGFRLE